MEQNTGIEMHRYSLEMNFFQGRDSSNCLWKYFLGLYVINKFLCLAKCPWKNTLQKFNPIKGGIINKVKVILFYITGRMKVKKLITENKPNDLPTQRLY